MRLLTIAAVLLFLPASLAAQVLYGSLNLSFADNQGRNFQNLYRLVPGFSPPAELHSDAGKPQRALGTNVNGASYSNNNTRLDGVMVSFP